MRKLLLTAVVILICFCSANAQKKQPLTESSVVKDSLGAVVPYNIWSSLLMTGHYKIKGDAKDNTEFILYRLSDEEYEKALETMPKPKESNFFTTGSKFSHFKTTDIDGNKINTKSLAGKIIVLNFWFINCPPCRMEMPELSKLADTYRADSSIVFLAIALDKKYELEEFLKGGRFGYTIIDNGRFITDQYRINGYPTNVIVDQNGRVYFHSTGLNTGTIHWLERSIQELKNSAGKKDATAKSE
jgi:thiol-disulfide isomerase/thioredoxin